MEIVKVLVDDCEYEYITSIDDDYIEYNNINNNYNITRDLNEDTIEIKNLFNNEYSINESSEIDG